MPIPPFDGILNVLPPHLGNPTVGSELSPYSCTVVELCERFATSPERKQILEGFLSLRKELIALGFRGFQWLDGSFLENIEVQEVRAPKDIDVVTFVEEPADENAIAASLNGRPELWKPALTKAMYFTDHYLLSLEQRRRLVVSQTRYWYGLFSHRRDGVWKGMLIVELKDLVDDDAARIVLGKKP